MSWDDGTIIINMDQSKKIFKRQLNLLIKNLGSKNISEYFDLNKNLNIELYPKNDYCNIKISYKNNNYIFYFPSFPKKLSEYISEFNNCYIEINFKIGISKSLRRPQRFPFKPLIWKLDNIKHRGHFQINLKKYYEYVINLHKEDLMNSNSICSLYLEKDILLFIKKINHFEYFDPLSNII